MTSEHIHFAMKHRSPVVHNGIRYDRITEYVSWYNDKGQHRLSVVLLDAKGNCTVRVPADKVEFVS